MNVMPPARSSPWPDYVDGEEIEAEDGGMDGMRCSKGKSRSLSFPVPINGPGLGRRGMLGCSANHWSYNRGLQVKAGRYLSFRRGVLLHATSC